MVFENELKKFFKKIEAKELSNGFRVVLYEDKRLPQVAVNITFHIGSKDEKEGERGYAHLFEHLMFQGSLNSPVDYFKALEKYGARVNGGTAEDRTIYWEVVPKGALEYVFFLESDRIKNLFPFVTKERLSNQIEVVKNEKRQIVENQPYGVSEEAISELLFPHEHPYRHPVIGYFEDLENATLEKMKSFFDRFYTPKNGSIAICGDIEKERTLELLEKYFGSIPSGNYYPAMKEWIPQIKGNPSMAVQSNVELKKIFYLWTVPSFFSEESKRLFVLSRILSKGKDSPLQKKLVVENPYCHSVSATLFNGEVCGVFSIVITLRKSEYEAKVEKIIFKEIDKIIKEGVEDKELNLILRGIESARVKALENLGGFGGLSDTLNFYRLYFGNPAYMEKEFKKLLKIRATEVESAANTFLSTSDFAKLSIFPKTEKKTIFVEKPEVKLNSDFKVEIPVLKKIKGGVGIYKLKESHIPFSTFVLMFKKGSKNDPKDKFGLAGMVSDLLDEGSSGKTNLEIAKELKEIGAFYDIICDQEAISLTISASSKYQEKAIKILSSMGLHPDFSEEEIERIKKLKISSILRSLKDPEAVGAKMARMVLLGKDTPYGHSPEGNISTIEEITKKDIVSFYKEASKKENISLLAVGDFEESGLNLFEKEVLNLPITKCSLDEPQAPQMKNESKIYFVNFKNIPSSFICAFTETVERISPLFPSVSIFNMILGGNFTSRLNKKMREEKGYTYGVKTFFLFQKGNLPWFLHSTVDLNKTNEAVLDILRELEKITGKEPPTKEEFDEAKNGFLARYLQNFETQEDRAANFSKLIAYNLPLDFYEKYYNSFQKTTLEEMVENSKSVFRKEKISFLIVGDVSKNNLKELPFDEIVELDPKEFF
ncbi:MAG: insulinase family protein [Acidobacteria bacterium]|nr:insulinase family protein [Acidobacteriota bacterium]